VFFSNHDHQVLIQTEPDDNVKDSTLKLALKHPTQTTIVQMQKDGTYRVVYGTDLDLSVGLSRLQPTKLMCLIVASFVNA
jgi:hypothetical protein